MLVDPSASLRRRILDALYDSGLTLLPDKDLQKLNWYADKWPAREKDFVEEINGRLARVLTQRETQVLSPTYYVTAPSFDFNGLTLRSADGATVVVANIGLRLTLFQFTAYHLVADDQLASNDREALANTALTLFCLAEFAATGVEPRFVTRSTSDAHPPPSVFSIPELPPKTHTLAAQAAAVQLDFVIAHELSHILLGHLDRSPAASLSLAGSPSDLSACSPTHALEFDADANAATLLSRNANWHQLLRLTLPVLFSTLHLLESHRDFLLTLESRAPLRPAGRPRTHPPALDRYHKLDVALGCDPVTFRHSQRLFDAVRSLYPLMKEADPPFA